MIRLVTGRPVAIFMITSALALFGALAYRQLGMELMPDLAYPTLTIRTDRPGAAPEEVESEITRTIEQRVGTVEALVGLHSASRADRSEVVLEFDWDTDMDRAAQRVRERLARLDLPPQAERPRLLRFDPTQVPVMRLALSGDGPIEQLRRYVDDVLSAELAKIEGVAAVQVLGGLEPEIHVELSQAALSSRGLSVQAVADQLRAANVNLAGGRLREGAVEFLVRTLAEVKTPEALGELVVLTDPATGARLRLRDVARIRTTTRPPTAVVRVDGREAVRIDLYRRADANIVEVCDRIRAATFGTADQQAWVARNGRGPPGAGAGAGGAGGDGPAGGAKAKGDAAKGGAKAKGAGKGKGGQGKGARGRGKAARERRAMTDFIAFHRPAGSRLELLSDQSVFIRAALDEVSQAALVGGLLAVLMLYLFLRSGYATFVIALAIPLSVLVTFAPMRLFGVGLNLMSLGGLALGIGMLVDNSVVVLESIHRCREAGDSVREAAIRGTREVGAAVVASTLTTVAVFFPIVFVDGVAGQIFGDLALAVVFSLLASLAVALFVVPTLAAQSWIRHEGGPQAPAPEAPDRWQIPWRALPRWWARRTRRLGWLLMVLTLPYALLGVILEALGTVALAALALVALPLVAGLRGLSRIIRAVAWPFAAAAGVGIEAAGRGYARTLRGALAAPLVVILAATALGAVAWRVGGTLGAELVPEVRQGVLTAELSFPVGTPLDETALRVGAFEAQLIGQPGIDRIETFVGEPDAADPAAGDRGPHTAAVTVHLHAPEAGDLPAREAALSERLRAAAARLPGVQLRVERPTLFSLRPPIRVVVRGHHLGLLAQTGEQVRALVAAEPGVEDVQSSVRPGYPELQISFDRGRLAGLGLTPRSVAESLRAQVDGEIATTLRDRGTLTDVRVRLDPDRTDDRERLGRLLINPGQPVPLPLEAVATLTPGVGPAEIRHVDGQRAAWITARTQGFDLGGTAERIADVVAALPTPAGFEVHLRGQDEEMRESLSSLRFALLLAIFLVYVVMASQFESLRAPLVIMGSVPLAAVGVVGLLAAYQVPLSVVVFVGGITLAGIVVNNAIVLVDYTGQLRARGLGPNEALVAAGRARLRPIMMTTLTTVLGLLPMAFEGGPGAELRRPIALTLIGGLVCSTLLTLVVIPVLYRWVVRAAPPPDGAVPAQA